MSTVSYILYLVITCTFVLLFVMILIVSCFGKRPNEVAPASTNQARPRQRRRRGSESNMSDTDSYYSTESDEENPITLQEIDYDIFLPIVSLHRKKPKLFDDCCSICIDGLKNGNKVRQIITCKHAFHSTCLLQWIKVNETCPNCKEDLNKEKLLEKLRTMNPKAVKNYLKKSGQDVNYALSDNDEPSGGRRSRARNLQGQRRRRRRAQRLRRRSLQREILPPPALPPRVRRRMDEVNGVNNADNNQEENSPNGGTVDLDSSAAILNNDGDGQGLRDSQLMVQLQMQEIQMWERQGEGNDGMIPVQMV